MMLRRDFVLDANVFDVDDPCHFAQVCKAKMQRMG
jgi:hypothetical protein